MVYNKSKVAQWPAFCWGCLTDTQMVNAKLHALLIRSVCRTTAGDACVLPFIYEGKEVKRCHSDWKNPRPWCATEVKT